MRVMGRMKVMGVMERGDRGGEVQVLSTRTSIHRIGPIRPMGLISEACALEDGYRYAAAHPAAISRYPSSYTSSGLPDKSRQTQVVAAKSGSARPKASIVNQPS